MGSFSRQVSLGGQGSWAERGQGAKTLVCGGCFCRTASRCHSRVGDKWGSCGRGSALVSDPGLTRGHVSSDCFTAEGTSYWIEGGEKGHGLPGSLSASTELWSFRNPLPGPHLVPGAGMAALQSPSLRRRVSCAITQRVCGKVGGRGQQPTSQPMERDKQGARHMASQDRPGTSLSLASSALPRGRPWEVGCL